MLYVLGFLLAFFFLFCCCLFLFFLVCFLKMNNNRLDRFESDPVLLAFAVTFALGLLPCSQPTIMNSRSFYHFYHMNHLYVLSLLLVHALHGRSDY